MDRQALLDNFVKAVNGKGRAVNKNALCSYFLEGHPGCAIGCQPGFREKFKSKLPDEGGIPVHFTGPYRKDLKEFFGIESGGEGVRFLFSLQQLHDIRDNWTGNYLRAEVLEEFCHEEGLEVPIP